MIVDTDVGYDDLLAILYLLAQGTIIEAFTVVQGICDVDEGAKALLRMQELLNLPNPIPVYLGSSTQPNMLPAEWRLQASKLEWGNPTHLTPAPISAQAFLSQRLADAPLSALAIGPLSNLAPALTANQQSVLTLHVMGGAFKVSGNLPPGYPNAEANFYVDPPSAATILSNSTGRPLVAANVVPLDACNLVPIDQRFVNTFQGLTPVTPFVKLALQILRQIQTEFISQNIPYFAFDPLAAASILDSGVLQQAQADCSVTIGPNGESTFAGGGMASIALSAVSAAFNSSFFNAFSPSLSRAESGSGH